MVNRKNIARVLGIISISAILTGCVSEKTRNNMLEELSKEGIIENNWRYIDSDSTSAAPIPGISSYEYYYEDDEGVVYEVSIRRVASQKEDTQKFRVSISDNMEVSEETEVYSDPETNKIEERNVTNYYKTGQTETDEYNVYKSRVLFWDIWKIEE